MAFFVHFGTDHRKIYSVWADKGEKRGGPACSKSTGLCRNKGPVLISTSQAQRGRVFSQLSSLFFARPCTPRPLICVHKDPEMDCLPLHGGEGGELYGLPEGHSGVGRHFAFLRIGEKFLI